MFKFRIILFMSFFFLFAVGCSATDANEAANVVEATVPTATAVPTVKPTTAPTEAPVEAEPETETLAGFVEQLQTAVLNQDYAAMQTLMSDPMTVAAWRAEGRSIETAQVVTEFQNNAMPAPTAVQFTGLTEAELTNLLGQPPAPILGPTTVATVLHSSGWGVGGNDEAMLYVSEEDGRYTWGAFLYTFGSFAQNGDDTDSGIFVAETDVNYVQAQQDVIMYSGPADTYDEIGGIFDGQTALVTGKSEDGAWWRVICPDDTIGDCWLTAVPAFTLPINPEADTTIPVVETDVKYVQAQQNIAMYSGPTDTYDEIGGVADGQTALVTGQSEDGNWWRVICPDDTIGNCWVTADTAFTVPANP